MFRNLDACLCRKRKRENFTRSNVPRIIRFGKLRDGEPVVGQNDR
jgi:hypothetical protein